MNLCKYCRAKQREHFLFNEVDSVFAPTNIKEAKELRIYEISLLFDIGFKGDFVEIFSCSNEGCFDNNELIYRHAKRVK